MVGEERATALIDSFYVTGSIGSDPAMQLA